MTEILERPDPADWSIDWTCGGCCAKLRSTGADVRIGMFATMGHYPMFCVECPICQRYKTWPMYTDELPGFVQHDAKSRRNT